MHVNLTREDTFPTTNIESLACGTPVITYRAGGSPESLDETCGRVIEKDDLEGVISAVKTLGKKTEDIKASCLKRAALYDRKERFGEYFEKCYKDYL
jgi:glycosyltransferase involved in cell wall biosynthesis